MEDQHQDVLNITRAIATSTAEVEGSLPWSSTNSVAGRLISQKMRLPMRGKNLLMM